ncbi:carbamoyltransferase HypF [Subtercola sp. PAMC28395]|uniref:carbamoyltransferase HypF n=1 Tax=Subtercola sp. PAMC28395 TaxID=2846775 RepID=UPI001C0B7645|nr:carbamoyltransferase HypF [Subtercola sp. PAMC28395]QWT23113.1 carbamoyltransferase HypF [Subtercola sp. PAMC28395]
MPRRSYVIRGVVQGVGFRPHVARVASAFRVSGFCGNDEESVFIEVQGAHREVAAFFDAVCQTLPPLASIVSWEALDVAELDEPGGFRIVASHHAAGARTLVPPDVACCAECLAELSDPADRRYQYPFITCTNCGPRLSIVRDLPYDRSTTTLAEFAMCVACTAEYEDPTSRRFHAQTISCFECGPVLWLQAVDDRPDDFALWGDAIAQARALLAAGRIVAVKGIGGFHLLCDATNDLAVARLRQRKNRPDKPLAIMVASLEVASTIASLSTNQQQQLASPQRPIVLCPQAPTYALADAVAPGLDDIGVMLPYAPLHELLLGGVTGARPGARPLTLVATSGNCGGEPLSYRNDDALANLAGIADAFLMHDRGIHVPVEDSVLLADGSTTLPIRRSRGYAPLPVKLGSADAHVLAVGGEVKNTFAFTRNGLAFLSAHIGDMGSLASQRAFEASVEQLVGFHAQPPQLVVADKHPGYATTGWAQRYCERTGVDLLQVQHHHAHALSLLAEHDAAGEDVAVAVFDGTGYGDDGTVWGGEILVLGADPLSFERAWHLPTFSIPGGESAVRNPWKLAVALLAEHGIETDDLPPLLAAPPAELRLVQSQLRSSTALVRTSSAGRIFDAISSLLGIRHHVSYEAQAAMELERAARECDHPHHAALVHHAAALHAGSAVDELGELLSRLVWGLRRGTAVSCLARQAHSGLAAITARDLSHTCEVRGIHTVGLSGGVFQNRLFTRSVQNALSDSQTTISTVLTHQRVPANDGGLSLGQALAGYLQLTS